MVGMLVFTQMRSQYHVRLKAADLPGKRNDVLGVVLNVAITAYLQELDGGADYARGVASFLSPFFWRARTGSLAFRSHQNAGFVPVPDFLY
jgi:hypothetical protein